MDLYILSHSLRCILFSEAILETFPFPHLLPAPEYMGLAFAFIPWQKILAIMHFIFTNIPVKYVTQIYEVLEVLVLGLTLSFHLPLLPMK